MQQDIEAVKAFYDENPQKEWERFDTHPSEFFITTKMMERLIRPVSVFWISAAVRAAIQSTLRSGDVT